ncbi:UNVERIFIED_CONTAM: Membrane steroid-binding protein 2 [Sesamum indicum]
MALWETLTESINHYTGLSPAAFFTILALMYVTYKVVCGMFVAADDYAAVKRANEFALREPVQMGDVTEEELRAYDGSDPSKPLLMAIKGQIYDVSRSRLVNALQDCTSFFRYSCKILSDHRIRKL